jgi:hypothetical protein
LGLPMSLDGIIRDEFFSLVDQGGEKELLGIRGVMKSVIDAIFRVF